MDKDFTLKDLMIVALKSMHKIIAVSVCIAIAFGFVGALLGYRNYTNEEQKKEQHTQFLQSQVAYENELLGLEREIELLKTRQYDLNEYAKNSIYYKINSYSKAVKEIVFYVKTDYQIMPSMAYQNPDVTEEIVSAYTTAYKSNDLYLTFYDILGCELDAKYISELVTVSQVGDADAIRIKACHNDLVIAEKLANETYEYIRMKVTEIFGEHEILPMSNAAFMEIDDNLKKMQTENVSEVNQVNQNLKIKQAEYDIKKEQEPEEEVPSFRSVLKKAILFACVGGIVGVFGVYLLSLLLYMLNNKVMDATDLKKRYKLEILGQLPKTEKKQKIGIFNKWASYLEGSYYNIGDLNECIALITSNINLAAKNTELRRILFVGTDNNELLHQFGDLLNKKFHAEVEILSCENLLTEADAIDNLINADAVVIVCNAGKTFLTQIDEWVLKVEKGRKMILGMILQQ